MMKGLGLDESMSNLTSTISGETSISSNARNENQSSSTATNVAATANTNTNTNTMLYTQPSASSFASTHQVQPPPAKKKRGLPGNPDPDAEVIALSPKSLLATNRFICEICNKGFQRDQNLQLHRRGHNLPWKLKQRAKDQVIRKKVYVCPEPSCVHHEPSRALGDLTGIKKHFCRKHGEKKWKCEKCSKKYAVQSDWKAHSKICGTREYRCDCGTLFSRRDSFITHRAFCDALAEESARGINPLINFPSSHQTGVSLNTCSTPLSHLTLPPHLSSHHQLLQSLPLKREPNSDQLFHNNNNNNNNTNNNNNNNNSNNNNNNNNNNIPPWLACPPPPQQNMVDIGGSHHPLDHHQQPSHLYTFNNQYDQNGGVGVVGPTLSSYQAPANPQMSATALLQKAAEMGVTVSTSCGLTGFIGDDQTEQHNQSSMLHDVMLLTSFQSNSVSGGFDSSGFGDFHQAMAATKAAQGNGAGGGSGGGGGNEGLTRDFLGLRTFSHKDFLNMAALGHMTSSSPSFPQQQHDHQNQTPW